jgi:DNA polymerase-3 subunit gamma/tau
MKIALARRYRPRTFETMVGQEVTLRALSNALETKRLHHAYLFTGTRGVGKTTVARILAKCLNCEKGITSTPCGQCSACQAIDKGAFVDLIEVDAASRTKVEDTRELLDNVQYLPTCGRFKIYLIDEVHMLSGHSFNALLKTLEEPPSHVKFLLATTDPQKLPVTVLSRCLQFHLWRIPTNKIAEYLANILQQEGVSFEKEALQELSRSADGSLRDALSLLDQALAYGNGHIETMAVRTLLGLTERERLVALLEAVVRGDGRGVLNEINLLAESVPDFAELLTEFQEMIHQVVIAQSVPEALDENIGGLEAIINLATKISAEELQLYYQITLQ